MTALAFPSPWLVVCSGGCGTFYAIKVTSPAFVGLSKVKQHRLVNTILKDEIKGIHGLTVRRPSTDPRLSCPSLLPGSRADLSSLPLRYGLSSLPACQDRRPIR